MRCLLLGTILVTMPMLYSKPQTCSSSTGYFCSLPNPHCHTISNLYCYSLYLCPISFKGFHMWFCSLFRSFKFSFISCIFLYFLYKWFLFSRSTFSYLCFSMSRINKITRYSFCVYLISLDMMLPGSFFIVANAGSPFLQLDSTWMCVCLYTGR